MEKRYHLVVEIDDPNAREFMDEAFVKAINELNWLNGSIKLNCNGYNLHTCSHSRGNRDSLKMRNVK
jgi:hypothetical protein